MRSSRIYSKAHHRRIIKRQTEDLLATVSKNKGEKLGQIITNVCSKPLAANYEENTIVPNIAPRIISPWTNTGNTPGNPDCTQVYVEVSESDSSDSGNDTVDVDNAQQDLAIWAVKNKVPHIHVNELLQILQIRNFKQFSKLPKDARTLVSTPRKTFVKKVSPGYYCHFGLSNGLKNYIESFPLADTLLNLQFNIDGIPISKSSNKHFVPILCYIVDSDINPFVVGLWCGEKDKPENVNDFLCDFVEESKRVIQNGVTINGTTYLIKIQCFVCDIPARAFVKSTKGHTGYSSCGKCIIEGNFEEYRTYFKDLNSPIRTDCSFRNKEDDQHHTGISIIEDLHIDLIKCFPVEYMHLICLGVVKKLILLWLNGKVSKFRLSTAQSLQISSHLKKLSAATSISFNRRPRSLDEVKRWKATEFRHFLLYSGPVVLKGILPLQHYQHLLVLHVAITILANPVLCTQHNKYAKELLIYCVEHFGNIYGKYNFSINVHSLLHLSEDVLQLGPIDKFSAFRFENYLGFLKSLIKKINGVLQQIHRRLHEINTVQPSTTDYKRHKYKQYLPRSLPDSCGPPCYEYIRLGPNILISDFPRDNCVELKNGNIFIIQNICTSKQSRQKVLVGYECADKNFFEFPCNS